MMKAMETAEQSGKPDAAEILVADCVAKPRSRIMRTGSQSAKELHVRSRAVVKWCVLPTSTGREAVEQTEAGKGRVLHAGRLFYSLQFVSPT